MKRPSSRSLLGLLLAATLLACAWVAGLPDPDLPEADLPDAAPAPRLARTATNTAPPTGLPIRQRLPDAPPRAAAHWQLPEPAAPPPAKPAPVVASEPAPPPLRLRYLGRLSDAERQLALLVGADGRTLMLGAGEQIDGQWQVERITPTTLELRWLRGTAVQRLRLGN